MKIGWVLTTVSAVVCTAASMVLFGQYALLKKLSTDEVEQRVKCQTFDATFNEKQFVKNTMLNQLDQQQKTVAEMEGEREKATLEQQQKSSELDFCKGDKKKKDRELADTEKEQADTEANLAKDSTAWADAIASLKLAWEQPSKICPFIKKNSVGTKLCAVAAAPPPVAAA